MKELFNNIYRIKIQINECLFFIVVRMPSAVNYSHPEKYGLRGTRNFYIKTHDNMTLGVWYAHCIFNY